MSKCILCNSKKINNIQKIKSKLIIDLYAQELKIDVSNELKNYPIINAIHCNNCKLVYFDPIVPGSEQFYENLQLLDNVYYSDLRPEFLEAMKFIKPDDNILEIGAGSAFFAEKLNNKNYVGLEYNQEAIDQAHKRGIKLIKKNIEDFSVSNYEKFDVVCSFHVLEHVSNPYVFIESSLKTLKKGGKFICAVPCSNSFLTSNVNHVLNMPPHHITRWNIETMNFICNHFNLRNDYFYNDKVVNTKNYFDLKMETKVVTFGILSNSIIINNKYFSIIKKGIKKITAIFKLYKIFKEKKLYGKNMILVATKL